jgi:Family of unknown function (DUF6611)
MDRQPNSGLLRRVCLRLLDGGHPWGSLDLQPDRFGVIRHRLVVFPPGISESERRRVRVARGLPAWGAVMWIGCEISLGGLIEPRIAFRHFDRGLPRPRPGRPGSGRRAAHPGSDPGRHRHRGSPRPSVRRPPFLVSDQE